jgi:broad specificity phosphatase PhoE
MVHSTPLLDTSPPRHNSTSQNSTSQVLWLVRHGESTWNARGLAQGHDDRARLTSRGLRQARAIAVQLGDRRIRALYASDLRRALQTAAPLASALGLTVVRDARLRERCLGVLEGTAAAAISPAVSGISDGRVVNPDACPDGGESLRDFYRRVARFAGDLADAGRFGDTGSAAPAGRFRDTDPAADAGRVGDTGPAGDAWVPGDAGSARDAWVPGDAGPARGAWVPGDAGPARGAWAPGDAWAAPGDAGPVGDVAIVAHGGTLRMLTACRQGVPVEEMTWDPLANATVLRSLSH